MFGSVSLYGLANDEVNVGQSGKRSKGLRLTRVGSDCRSSLGDCLLPVGVAVESGLDVR